MSCRVVSCRRRRRGRGRRRRRRRRRLSGWSPVGRGWVVGSCVVAYYTVSTGACTFVVVYYTFGCPGGESVVLSNKAASVEAKVY